MIIEKQRVVIGMIDGFGMDYFASGSIPVIKSMARNGFFKPVKAVFPTVTNTNNVSICCGVWPKDHGITGNSYFDESTGTADYMESADFIRKPTILERAAQRGMASALLTCKDKTIRLLSKGATIAVAAEKPPADLVDRFGKPADIYSREINYWFYGKRQSISCASGTMSGLSTFTLPTIPCTCGLQRRRNLKSTSRVWIA